MIVHFRNLKHITISAQTVFLGSGYLQHSDTAWSGTPSIRYHMYLILHGHELMDVVSFACGLGFRNDGEPRVPFSTIFEHSTVHALSQ